jgi:uncharacterized caspase-like protein
MKVASKDKSYIIKGKVSDESGVYEVLVNGKDANLSQTGDFWAEIKMAVGENKVIVKATDTENNSSEESFFLVREGGAAPAPEEPKAPDTQPALGGARYFALIIAVQDYGDRSINPLANPIKDGQELITALTISYDFEKKDAKLLKNPGRSEILTALNDLRKQVSATDNVLIFYAGHGYWDAEIKQGYWLPSDATKDNRANWISNSDLRDNIRGIKSRHTLLISDACFSGGIFRTRAAFSNAPPAIQELYQLPSRKAMTSGTLTEVPDESVFLSYLIKRLKDNKEKYLTAEGLFTSFKQAVISNSRQVPQFGEIQDAGDEGGDFVFVRK